MSQMGEQKGRNIKKEKGENEEGRNEEQEERDGVTKEWKNNQR